MKITFSSEKVAKAAVSIWERNGFRATRTGPTIVTDCPTLWAVPILRRAIGFDRVEKVAVDAPGVAAGKLASSRRPSATDAKAH